MLISPFVPLAMLLCEIGRGRASPWCNFRKINSFLWKCISHPLYFYTGQVYFLFSCKLWYFVNRYFPPANAMCCMGKKLSYGFIKFEKAIFTDGRSFFTLGLPSLHILLYISSLLRSMFFNGIEFLEPSHPSCAFGGCRNSQNWLTKVRKAIFFY